MYSSTLPLNKYPRQAYIMVQPELFLALIDGADSYTRAEAMVVLKAQIGDQVPGRRQLSFDFGLQENPDARQAYRDGLERVEQTCGVRFDKKERRRMARADLPPLLTRRRAARSPNLKAHLRQPKSQKPEQLQQDARAEAAERAAPISPEPSQPRAVENSLSARATSRLRKAEGLCRYQQRAAREKLRRRKGIEHFIRTAGALGVPGSLETAGKVLDGAMWRNPVLTIEILAESKRWLHRVSQVRPWKRLTRWRPGPALGGHLKFWLREQDGQLRFRSALDRPKPDERAPRLGAVRSLSWDEMAARKEARDA